MTSAHTVADVDGHTGSVHLACKWLCFAPLVLKLVNVMILSSCISTLMMQITDRWTPVSLTVMAQTKVDLTRTSPCRQPVQECPWNCKKKNQWDFSILWKKINALTNHKTTHLLILLFVMYYFIEGLRTQDHCPTTLALQFLM